MFQIRNLEGHDRLSECHDAIRVSRCKNALTDPCARNKSSNRVFDRHHETADVIELLVDSKS